MNTVLLLVDVQRNMLLPPTPVPSAGVVSFAIEDLLRRAREAGTLVVHIRNCGTDGDPDVPGTPGWELVHEVLPGEHVIDKRAPDAFAGTELGALIPQGAAVVVAGMQSEFCVGATAPRRWPRCTGGTTSRSSGAPTPRTTGSCPRP